jgi:hypothetical protein
MSNPAGYQEKGKALSGVVGFFDSDHALMEAARRTRDARGTSGIETFDVFSPYPIHGMDDAMGLKRSPLPFVTFGAGLTGFCCAFLLQYITSAVDWPLIVGGKPFNSWPAFVPIMFELTVLFAGLCTVAGMFILNRLPNISRKTFDPGITRDRFALMIDAPAPRSSHHGELEEGAPVSNFNESQATDFLRKIGAREVRSVYAEGWF